MRKFAAIAIIPMMGGFLFAQDESRTTRTVSTKTTWNGTLVDAACQSSHTEHHQSSSSTNGVTTRSESSRTETVDCPVTTTTTTFGLITSDGRFIRFDEPSNTRVVQIVREKTYNRYLNDREPLRVNVVGASNGDMAVVETLNPVMVSSGEAERVVEQGPSEAIFDVRWHGDRGKLVITPRSVNFEDISDSKHSRSWSYSEIKELNRHDRNEIKVEPHNGDAREFHVEGAGMPETVYNMIANRIAAARAK